jgi:HAD domain in Swiss Army Knife RNA repair proteins
MTRPAEDPARPLLLVDIDGVISLFGRAPAGSQERLAPDGSTLEGSFHSIEGIPHFLSSTAAAHLLSLASLFELVWASGWEERANEHLPHLLGLPEPLPFLRFPRQGDLNGAGDTPVAGLQTGPQTTLAHWKLQSIDSYAGQRPLAWIDDAFNAACHDWAQGRPAATLLVQTEPELGLTSPEARLLERWARELAAG